jgi:glutamate carboxypeptidase
MRQTGDVIGSEMTGAQILLERCRGQMPDLLTDFEELIHLASPSDDLGAVAESAKLVARIRTEPLGVSPEVIRTHGRNHVSWKFGSGPRRVLLLAHHDSVWTIGSLISHPGNVADCITRGPGCFEMKTGLVPDIGALQLRQTNCDPALDGETLRITRDEEFGLPISRELIESEANRCAAAFVLEASGPADALKNERTGVSPFTPLRLLGTLPMQASNRRAG